MQNCAVGVMEVGFEKAFLTVKKGPVRNEGVLVNSNSSVSDQISKVFASHLEESIARHGM
jgi:hypothetical protein